MTLVQSLKLDQNAVRDCQMAVDETFSCLFGIRPELKEITGNTEANQYPEISGVMPFIQYKEIEGALKVTFQVESICALMSDFYGEPIEDVNRRVIGGVGEITNIVFGILKEKFNSSGSKIKMCLPEVVVGGDHDIFSSLTSQNLLLDFNHPKGSFTVEILLLKGAA